MMRGLRDIPPKSGRRRISYPFSSLSTVSLTKDMFPGSLTLQEKSTTGTVSVSAGGEAASGPVGCPGHSPLGTAHQRHDQRHREDVQEPCPVAAPHPSGAVRGPMAAAQWEEATVLTLCSVKSGETSSTSCHPSTRLTRRRRRADLDVRCVHLRLWSLTQAAPRPHPPPPPPVCLSDWLPAWLTVCRSASSSHHTGVSQIIHSSHRNPQVRFPGEPRA